MKYSPVANSNPVLSALGSPWLGWVMLTVARLATLGACHRAESRGTHFRSDHPARDDAHWRVHIEQAPERMVDIIRSVELKQTPVRSTAGVPAP